MIELKVTPKALWPWAKEYYEKMYEAYSEGKMQENASNKILDTQNTSKADISSITKEIINEG